MVCIAVLLVLYILMPAALLFAAPPAGLETLLDDKGMIWKTGRDDFIKEHASFGFEWLSDSTNDNARAGRGQIFLGLPVEEALVRFEKKGLRELTFSLYNRGDAGVISKAGFDELTAKAQEMLSEWTGVKPVTVTDPLEMRGIVKEGLVWTRPPHQFKLEWSYSAASRSKTRADFKSEYVRLRVQQSGAGSDYRSSMAVKNARGKSVSLTKLKSNVKTEKNGDVWISGVPMVDQGMKGYCVAAATERVMRYYGRDIDQHEIAQMAGTSVREGTDPRAMIAVLRKCGIALGCRVNIFRDFTVARFVDLLDKYNKAAEREDMPVIHYGKVINLNKVYNSMDVEVYREVRLKQKAEMRGFQQDIEKSVKTGIPLVWSIYLGLVAEVPELPQASGGHMRLIIGWNPKTSEVIYTDTWGRGHEFKRMSLEDAWTITLGLYAIEPRYGGR